VNLAAWRGSKQQTPVRSCRAGVFVLQENFMTDIHPAPPAFTEAEVLVDPILQFFNYAHLTARLDAICAPFCGLAICLITTLPHSAERSMALRKLLEAKDCAVRAMVQPKQAHHD
jgi:hypothetical protein